MDVLVLGAASWNRMIHVEALPQGGASTIFDACETTGAGSTGVGKAMALAALRHPVTLQCALGADEYAAKIEEACTARGIHMLVDRQTTPTPRHVNIMDKAGGRYSIFVEAGDPKPRINTQRIAPFIDAAKTIFLSLSASSKVILPLLADCRADIWLDIHDYDGNNPWYDDFIALADHIQLSDVSLGDPLPTIQRLLDGRAREVILTMGGEGARIFSQSEVLHVPPCPAQVVDSNGAGDAFSVAYFHALHNGQSNEAAARFAAAAAAQTVETYDLIPKGLSPEMIWARVSR